MGSSEKNLLREQIKQFFKTSVSTADRIRMSDMISQCIMEQLFFESARSVMAYCALPDEVDLINLLKQVLAGGKKLIVPKTDTKNNTIIPCEIVNLDADLSIGYAGILEPSSIQPVSPDEIDVVLVPGRVFDKAGHRIGRGAGCYDRFFEMSPAVLKVGVAFDFQLMEHIEVDTHDVTMDMMITEKNNFKNSKLEKSTNYRRLKGVV